MKVVTTKSYVSTTVRSRGGGTTSSVHVPQVRTRLLTKNLIQDIVIPDTYPFQPVKMKFITYGYAHRILSAGPVSQAAF